MRRLHLAPISGTCRFPDLGALIVINAALQHICKTRTQPALEGHLQSLEQSEMLEDALHKLPGELRQAIQLCKSTDYSLKEAASALGLPVSTLKARWHRGRRALMVRVKREM